MASLTSQPQISSDLESLFGAEPTSSLPASNPLTHSNSSSREAQLSSLRAQPVLRPQQQNDKDPELTSLRHQLELLLAETVVIERIRLVKSAIIQQIRVLEGEQALRVEEEKRVKLSRAGLPEPVAKGEKKKLMASAMKVAKAKAQGMKPQKRKKSTVDEDDYMDGEEKLRLGLPVKIKKTKAVRKRVLLYTR